MDVKNLGKLLGRELTRREKFLVKGIMIELQEINHVYRFGEAFFYEGYLFFIRKENYAFYIIVSHQWGRKMVKCTIKEETLENGMETIKYLRDKAIKFWEMWE